MVTISFYIQENNSYVLLFRKDIILLLLRGQSKIIIDLMPTTFLELRVYKTVLDTLFTMAVRGEQLPVLELAGVIGIPMEFDNIKQEKEFLLLLRGYKTQGNVRSMAILNYMKGLKINE